MTAQPQRHAPSHKDNAPPPPPAGSKWRQERERRAVRELLAVEVPHLQVARERPQPVEPLTTVAFLRPLARRALFCAARPGTLTEPQAPSPVADMYGEVRRYGYRLSWWDARTLAWVTEMFRRQPPALRRRPEVQLPAHRLALELSRPHQPGQRAVQRAQMSLLRLTQAQFAFEAALSDSEKVTVGSSMRPETLLRRDDDRHPAGVYAIAGWLHQLLLRGVDDASSGLMQYKISWPVLRSLEGRAVLLYLLLESHNWNKSRQQRCPFDPDSAPDTRNWYWLLKQPFWSTLDLTGQPVAEQRRRLRDTCDLIAARDHRYHFAFDDGIERLLVWRDASNPGRWAGALCARCKRPDPHRSCCCDSARACGDAQCARCRS